MLASAGIRNATTFGAGVAAALVAVFVFHAVAVDAVEEGESTLVPITPCRLFDTRPGDMNVGPRSSPLVADETHVFQVTGDNGDCSIPAAATAVSINLTGVAPTSATNLRMFPAGADVPNAAVLNMSAGQAPVPNKLDVKLSSSGRVAVYNRFGEIHVIGDVMGYYLSDGLTQLESDIEALDAAKADLSSLTQGLADLQADIDALDASKADLTSLPNTLGIGEHFTGSSDVATFGDFDFVTTSAVNGTHTITFADTGCEGGDPSPTLFSTTTEDENVVVTGSNCTAGEWELSLQTDDGGVNGDIDFSWVVFGTG